MSATPGTHDLGPSTGELLLRTTSEGKMAKMGHALTIAVENWHGQLVIGETPKESSLRVTVALTSLRVREGTGGATPLNDGGRRKIEDQARKSLNASAHPELTFTSTAIDGTWESGRVEGTVTLNGRTETESFEVTAVEGGFRLTGPLTQSRFGLKPYSAMMGQLRVGDDVIVEATVRL